MQYSVCTMYVLHHTGGYITIIKLMHFLKLHIDAHNYKNEHVHVYRRPQFIARLPIADESGCPLFAQASNLGWLCQQH